LLLTPLANQTGLGDFGHFRSEVPETSHIDAYPVHIYAGNAWAGRLMKVLQIS
jgi:hypothetical protein